MIAVAEIGRSMQSTGRPNFWIPPESTYETAVPSPTSASRLPEEPATPTRVNTRFNRPPLPLPSPQKQPQRYPNIPPPGRPPSPQPVRHNDRTGKEYNRRERRFEIIFNQWSQEVARLQEEHRTVSLKCRNEEETTLAMDNFNRKVQNVIIKYNEEIEALQMSSSEPPSSQSENEEEEEDSPTPTPARNRSFQFHQNDASNEEDGEDEEGEEDTGEEDEDDEDDPVPGGVDPPEHALDDDDDEWEDEDDEDRASTPLSEAIGMEMSSGDDTDHSARLSRRSGKSYQSSEVSQGSLNLNTPPPTEIDEDHRAARRRQARERMKTDELASALPQRLRSETLRGTSPLSATAAPRPAAMSLFENLSSSPASMSSMPSSQHASSPYGSRRPSRDVPTARPSPIDVNPAAIASRIDYLRRQSSTSGSDRSLSRNRASSPAGDERRLFKDQFEGWKSSIQNQSEAVLKKVEKQTEDVKHKFKQEQEEKHQRAQQIFIAEQERLLQSFSRNRAGSTGSTTASASPAVGSHPRSGSIAIPQGHAIGPSVSPTLHRGIPSPAPQSNSPAGRPLHSTVSQTFQYASVLSQSPPKSSPSRTWVPRNTPVSGQPGNRRSTASSSESEELDGPIEGDESDAQPTYKGTPPISIPNSARGSFDMGHHRTGSQVYSGTSGASSTPRNPFPQHLRNSSSTTFSSNGTASARSSGGWSGVSGATSNTTVTSSDTPGSRRGSVGEKTFVPPTNLHAESRKNPNGLTVGTSPPSGPRWSALVGSVDAPGSVSHSPASTLSRASAAAMNPNSSVNIPPRTTVQQWRTDASASSPSAASAVPPIANPGTSIVGSLPRPSIGSLNLTQSPGKGSWKATATGKPSPPIPIQTKPSGQNPQRSGSISNASPSFPLGSVSRDSPMLRSSMSNVDLVSASGPRNRLKSRQSTSAFNAPSRENSIDRGSRSKSPSKPVIIPSKSSPSPAKVSSTQLNANLSDMTQSSPEVEATLPKREQKRVESTKRTKQKEEAERQKREEDLKRREEEINRREEEIKREQREEKKRREKEAERKRDEDLLRREAELREREERLKRQEAEIAEAKRRREAEEAEAEAKRQKEAELVARRQREEAEEARRREDADERQGRNSLDEQHRRASQPSKKKGKKGAKRSTEEQRELEAAKERERIAEEERLAEEARLEEERLEEERLEEEARLEEERLEDERLEALARLEEEARREAARLEAEQRKEAKRRDQEARRLASERQKQERADARLAAEILEQEQQEEDRRRRESEARRAAERREQEKLEEEREKVAREQRKAELYRQEQEALRKLAEDRERKMHGLRQEDDRRHAWTRQHDQREEEMSEKKRSEEERRAQEARIREENDRMTERFQARDRSNQMNTNMPKRYADAWLAYDEKWKNLVSQAQNGGRPLTFATVPWPLLNAPSGPDAITRVAVGNFVLSQWHSKGKAPRERIREALLRWHPDRFESRYLGLAPEGDERENVRMGVGNVTRSLNELLTKEGPSAPL